MKTCTKCGEKKPLSEFYNCKRSKGGKEARCKVCKRNDSRRWHAENRGRANEARRARYVANIDHEKLSRKRWREDKRELCLEKSRAWYRNNKERHAEVQKAWAKRNKELCRENHKRWREENKEHFRTYRNNYYRAWYARKRSDPDYRLSVIMRVNLRKQLERIGTEKEARTSQILRYSPEELRRHLERQFTKGMSWDNYGEWHIDHIIPVAEHIRNGETDPAVINCLTNLRPMWAADNMSKSDSRTHLL